MRKIITAIFITLFVSNYCNSQSGWEKKIIDSTKNLAYVQFHNSKTGYILSGDVRMYKTTDSGNNWLKILEYINNRCDGMSFVDSVTGYISHTLLGYPYFGAMKKTTNGGISFVLVREGGSMPNLYFFNSMTGWFSGYGDLFKTTNGGNNWTTIAIPSLSINRILFLNINTGYYLSNDCRFYKTTNGGYNWALINYISYYATYDLFVSDTLNGYIAGALDSGRILKTTNGGYNWFNTFTTSEQLRKIKFVTNDVGYVIGDTNKIYRTSNKGYNWTSQTLDPAYKYSDFCFVNIYTGWVVGTRGIVMRTTNGGSTFINESFNETPLNYSLSQNYPNPFNPVTKIKFEVPLNKGGLKGVVSLKVYDILGKEIQTLVNEQLQPGTYEVTFDGTNLPSGVYFYQLRAGGFTETKKLILLK